MAYGYAAYPRVRYHKVLAPDGITVYVASAEPDGPGWVDSPAAFDPHYVPLTEDPLEGTPFETFVAPAEPPLPYPAVRYDRHGGERTIGGPDEEQDGWLDHPWTPADLEAGSAPADPLWQMTVVQAQKVIAEMTALEELEGWLAREHANPKGPRKGVLAAITERLEALTAPPHG